MMAKNLVGYGIEGKLDSYKRLYHYWIQPDFVLNLRLIKRLINGSLHNDVAACSAWIPYWLGTDFLEWVRG
jgi:hypothetical protein